MTTPEIQDGKPMGEDEKRLREVFDDLSKSQLTFLDEAAKRIIELTTGLLGGFFAVIALGKDFPPKYLVGNPLAQWLAALILGFYVLAMVCGVISLWPRTYKHYSHNLTGLRTELDKITRHKSLWYNLGSMLFVIGCAGLALLIMMIIFEA